MAAPPLEELLARLQRGEAGGYSSLAFTLPLSSGAGTAASSDS
jgi:hypothetical protein